MDLSIKNYKNIKNLSVNVDDKKINFIYGVSGSGKSSLATALKGEINEKNISYGKSKDDVDVCISPEVNVDDVSIFNELSQQNLLLNRIDSNNMYSIIFANDGQLKKIREDISEVLARLNSKREILNIYTNNVDNMIKKINKRKFTKKEEFSDSSSLEKIKQEMLNQKYNSYSKFVRDNGLEYVQWVERGTSFPELYENEKCPFCRRKLTLSRINKIKDILEIKPEHYALITDSQDVLYNIGIEVPKFFSKREVNKLESDLYDAINNKNIVNNMYSMIDSYSYNTLDINKVDKIKLSKSLIILFPELYDIVEDFNNNIKQLKKLLGKLMLKTSKIVGNNLKKLNDYLTMFSIPYKFSIENFDTNKKTANVYLISLEEVNKIDRTDNLSYGEKNLISLLLFLVSDNSNVIVIDDPASSYDDNRRKIIYELLFDFHKDRTFIVLSHDQVFVKYALLGIKDKVSKKYENNTGKVLCLENLFGNCSTKVIDYQDFDSLDKQVYDFLNQNNLCYYRKIINLRILAETKKSRSNDYRIVYEYLSAILHQKSYEITINELREKGYSEDKVITIIFDKFKVNLEKCKKDVLDGFNYDELTNFEKIAFKREEAIKKRNGSNHYKKKTYIENEFDDIIHLNTRYFISLNPYKFDIFSPQIYSHI